SLTPDLLRAEDLRQVAPALLFGAELDQRRPDHLDAHHADETGRPGADHLLVEDRLAHDVGALTAPLLRPGEREVADLVHLPLPGLRLRDAARVAELERASVALALRDVLPEPGSYVALEGALLRRVAQVHRRVGSTSRRGWTTGLYRKSTRASSPRKRSVAGWRGPRISKTSSMRRRAASSACFGSRRTTSSSSVSASSYFP